MPSGAARAIAAGDGVGLLFLQPLHRGGAPLTTLVETHLRRRRVQRRAAFEERASRMRSRGMSGDRELTRTWRTVLGRLEIEVSRANYETWLKATRPLAREGGALVVEAPSSFHCDWLNSELATLVRRAVADALGEELAVRFVAPGQPVARPASGATASGAVAGRVNRELTLGRYLRSGGNAYALEACLQAATDPDAAISPVVVWGGSGTGKSHLLHAAAAEALSRGRSVALFGGEEFVSRYQRALRASQVGDLEDALGAVELLIIDDLQDLAGNKGATQRLLVQTLDGLRHGGGHVLAASEARPEELDLPKRLSARLSEGVVARLEPFAPNERRALIARRAADLRQSLPSWAIDRLAAVETPSVRTLVAAVHAAIGLSRQGRLDPGALDAELACLITTTRPARSPTEIVAAVAAHFGATEDEIASRKRTAMLADARALAAAALRYSGRSYPEIGGLLGKRDRKTVRELAERGERLAAGEPALRRLLSAG